MVLTLGMMGFVLATYVLRRYTSIARRVAATYAQYQGDCDHEHSLYDVEETFRRLANLQGYYVVLLFLLLDTIFG